MNSPQEVTNVCVSVLHQETSNSQETSNPRSAWLLVVDIDIEMSKAFLTTVSAKVSAISGTFNTFVA